MSTKKWLLGAIGGALLAGAATANATETIDVRLVRIDGTLFASVSQATKDALGNPTQKAGVIKTQNVADMLAHTYQFDVYASVYGADNQSNNEGAQSLIGNIAVDKGVVTVAPAGAKPKDGAVAKVVGMGLFQDNGSQNGKLQTWGMGSAPATVADDYVVMRAASMQTYDITQDPDTGADIIPTQWRGNGSANAGIETRVGSFTIQFTQWGGDTKVAWQFAQAPTGGLWNQASLWQEDGASKDALSGQLASIGYDFQVVPEPAGLSVLALGALGLLARRRK